MKLLNNLHTYILDLKVNPYDLLIIIQRGNKIKMHTSVCEKLDIIILCTIK